MSIQRLSHDYLRNEVSYDDSGPFMYYAEHVAEIERIKGTDDHAIYMDGVETMRAACIAAVETLPGDPQGWHGIFQHGLDRVIAALREVQP